MNSFLCYARPSHLHRHVTSSFNRLHLFISPFAFSSSFPNGNIFWSAYSNTNFTSSNFSWAIHYFFFTALNQTPCKQLKFVWWSAQKMWKRRWKKSLYRRKVCLVFIFNGIRVWLSIYTTFQFLIAFRPHFLRREICIKMKLKGKQR